MNIEMRDGAVYHNGEKIGEFDFASFEQSLADSPGLGKTLTSFTIPLKYTALDILKSMKMTRHYGPCVGCGNPAKNGFCFKCETKAKNEAGKAVDNLSRSSKEAVSCRTDGRGNKIVVLGVREEQPGTLEAHSALPGRPDSPVEERQTAL